MSITLSHFLVLSAILFALGVFGLFFNRRNLISLLMSIELILLSVNMNFVSFSQWHPLASGAPDIAGQIFVFFILTVAAAEAAIGLAILVMLFRKINSINVDDIGHFKG